MFCRRLGAPDSISSSLQQSLLRVSSSTSSHTRKIKSSLKHVYLSSSHNNMNLSPLPSFFPDSHVQNDGDGDAIFGPVPSDSDVENALITLQQVFGSASRQYVRNVDEVDHVTNTSLVDQVFSDGSETDWKEPSLSSYNPRMLQTDVFDKVTFAVHLLQSDACVQRMVKSLSSDKSLWDAVLKNESVRELRSTITAERDRSSNETVDNESPNTKNVFMRISDAAKGKLMEAIQKIMKMMKNLFQSTRHWKYAGKSNLSKDKLRVSVMLSIMIFLMVVVDRFYLI
ncbi:hypothetical protein GmHk_12G033564 [Glycine max]|nr:hypothetical protein GmHk_12G033564 [Glycine max]